MSIRDEARAAADEYARHHIGGMQPVETIGDRVRAAFEAGAVWASEQADREPTPLNGKWVCGKCAREVARGHDDGQIPEHHRTCPKRADQEPSDAEVLAAKAVLDSVEYADEPQAIRAALLAAQEVRDES